MSLPFPRGMCSPKALLFSLLSALPLGAALVTSDDIRLNPTEHFTLLAKADLAPVILTDSEHDAKLVALASQLFVSDLAQVTGLKASLNPPKGSETKSQAPLLLVGTLGHSERIDALVAAGKLDASALRGAWEAHLITTVKAPFPGVDSAIVIVGSDRRGTAYGILSLSEAIGVSPWSWWADVPVRKADALYLREGAHLCASPKVHYRGIFINDEDWGLQPWAAKTFEPEHHDIGPKTYAKVFELLLRLKANTLWPAMHACSAAFNSFPENARLADDYGIVMGASHCEPLLRNGVREWDKKADGDWNYVTNSGRVLSYWEERMKTNGGFENLYTVGMRGIHDSGMPGGGTLPEQRDRLQRIISDQRGLLAKYTQSPVAKVPQVFCPYKEVMDIYRQGLKLPEDITLLWADDNYGYVRQLSNAEERKRSGGSGVYYHLSYLGSPMSYVWLYSTPPALIVAEMGRAYAQDARQVWIANIGDIKPGEIGMDFFLRFAWDPELKGDFNQADWLKDWASRAFGPSQGPAIGALLQTYFRQNFPQKPEFAHINREQLVFDADSGTGPAFETLARRRALLAEARTLQSQLPAEAQDAYYELVLYPIAGAEAVNRAALFNELARRRALAGQAAEAGQAQELAAAAWADVQSETAFYNEKLAGGKWRHMMYPTAYSKQRLYEKTELPAAGNPPHRYPVAPIFTLQAEDFIKITPAPSGVTLRRLHDLGADSDALGLSSFDDVPYDLDKVMRGNSSAGYEPPPPLDLSQMPRADYSFTLPSGDNAVGLLVYALPTHPNKERGYQLCWISIDDAPAQVVSFNTASDEKNPQWRSNILRGFSAIWSFAKLPPGQHRLSLWLHDAGVTIDRIDFMPANTTQTPARGGND